MKAKWTGTHEVKVYTVGIFAPNVETTITEAQAEILRHAGNDKEQFVITDDAKKPEAPPKGKEK